MRADDWAEVDLAREMSREEESGIHRAGDLLCRNRALSQRYRTLIRGQSGQLEPVHSHDEWCANRWAQKFPL